MDCGYAAAELTKAIGYGLQCKTLNKTISALNKDKQQHRFQNHRRRNGDIAFYAAGVSDFFAKSPEP
jgi:hypothetical protein